MLVAPPPPRDDWHLMLACARPAPMLSSAGSESDSQTVLVRPTLSQSLTKSIICIHQLMSQHSADFCHDGGAWRVADR